MHKSIISICCLVLSVNLSYSQISLHPDMGVTFALNRLKEKNLDLKAHNLKPNYYFGFGIEKKYKNYSIGLSYAFNENELAVRSSICRKHKNPNTPLFLARKKPAFFYATGTTQSILTAKIIFDIKEIKYKPSQISPDKNKILNYYGADYKYKSHFVIQQIFGIGINYVHPANWDGYSPDSSDLDSSYNVLGSQNVFEYVKYGNGDKIVANHFGLSLQIGLRFQVKKGNLNRLQINLLYSQGLIPLLASPFRTKVDLSMYDNSKNNLKIDAFSISRGSFFTIYTSYPITIMKKNSNR